MEEMGRKPNAACAGPEFQEVRIRVLRINVI